MQFTTASTKNSRKNEACDSVDLCSIPHISSQKGIHCDFNKNLVVSSKADLLIGFHVQGSSEVSLIKHDFASGRSNCFEYKHRKMGQCILLNEQFKYVLSGGNDCRIVVHDLSSLKMLKVINFGKQKIMSLLDLGNFVCLGQDDSLNLLNLITLKPIPVPPIKTSCKTTATMLLAGNKELIQSGDHSKMVLLVGGFHSENLTAIRLPEILSKLGESKCKIKNSACQFTFEQI